MTRTGFGRTIEASLTTADGRNRTYHLYVPSTISAGGSGAPVPLLVALHGGLGSGVQFERNSGFDGLAESNWFIVVYPDGIGVGASGTALRTWNGGACCGPATRQNVRRRRLHPDADRCRRRSTSQDRSNPDVTIETWRSRSDQTEVRFVTVEGASHAWMGHPTTAPRLVGEPYMKLDSSREIWEFLVAHPRV